MTMATITKPDAERVMKSVEEIRADFPILTRLIDGKPLSYLDNGATSQKPLSVIEAMNEYYRRYNSNVHRGVHKLSEEATAAYEQSRLRIGRFINANSDKEIVVTKGTTESINLVANSWGRANLGPGDEVLITEMEHHSNIVPWQLMRDQLGFTLRYIPITMQGELDFSNIDELLNERTKLVAFTHVSNVLGTINPVDELVEMAHTVGAKVLLDGAQSVPHIPVDVQALDIDFMAFSGHKMCGPTGVGILYAKRANLEEMPPWMGGGDMIREVKMEASKWNTIPYKFEAGTPPIAELIGLGAAVDYLSEIGMENVAVHDAHLVTYAWDRLNDVEGLSILGPGAEERSSLISFTFGEIHPHDLSAILDRSGVAIRAGHHCAQPVHDKFGISGSARASMYLYNTKEEIDRLVEGLEEAVDLFAW